KGDGSPGASADIIIRGAGSLNGMSPLYVVDGVAQETGFNFNMRDVETIEILKDAGSAAIYGSKAAGGVVLITTK
ncbi:MAG: TonB-dependent receptor plug domain-containing protein, partial [Dysgonomonas sp.]